MNSIEVLSPVGSEEMLIAAVRSGADAVYLGAGDFNARRNAANFDDEGLKNAVKYCHIRGVRVYLTLNILIRDDEIEKALSLAKKAYLYGIDGIILQDVGLAALIKKAVPNLPLHASTQMSVHTLSALSLLKEMGFCRVVVAREMAKNELEKLCQEAKRLDMEIEVFVHGALCMSVSGQCALSSMLGTRSGNRGLCAGPCRLPFTARGRSDDFALSLKDLSLIYHIDELKKMGVASLKIEGRLKRPEYVAAATAAVSAAARGEMNNELNDMLGGVFSRSGFTDGYFTGKRDADMFGVRTKDDIEKSKTVLSSIHELYRNERQSIGVEITAEIKADLPIKISLCDGENTVMVLGDIPESAKNKAAESEQLEAALKKLGGTPYFAKAVNVTLDDGLFVSASALNELRRKAVDALTLKRGETQKVLPTFNIEKPKGEKEGFKGFIINVSHINQLEEVENSEKISAVVVPLEQAREITRFKDSKKWISIPRGIENEEKTFEMLITAKEMGYSGAVCENLGAIPLAKKAGLEIIGGMGLNIYNSYTAQELKNMGAKTVFLSFEQGIRYLKDNSADVKKALAVYGRMPLMLLRNCPVKAQIGCKKCDGKGSLTDRMGKVFPVTCRMGYSTLLNSVPLVLDKEEDITALDYAILHFTTESQEDVAKTVKNYLNGTVYAEKDFTRGLYFRNVE